MVFNFTSVDALSGQDWLNFCGTTPQYRIQVVKQIVGKLGLTQTSVINETFVPYYWNRNLMNYNYTLPDNSAIYNVIRGCIPMNININ
jgi:hypothetical protein